MASLNPNLRSYWQDDNGKLIKARIRGLHGGRASSKSWEFAGRAAQIGQEYKTRFLCVRRFQNKIKESVYTLIKNQIEHFNFGGYLKLASEIRHDNGTEFVFYGIERNLDEIKSFEGADVLWVEEAHNLTKAQWEILEPTIRKEGSEIWLSWNGRFINDFIWQRFIVNPPKDSIIRWINYDENPFLSKTMLKTINELKEEDPERHEHIYLGKPLSDEDQVIIKRSWLEAATDFHLETDLILTGAEIVGYDVADSGEDKNATVSVNGSIVYDCQEWKGGENELSKSAKRVKLLANKVNAKIIYDSIGVGAGTGSTLNDLSYPNHSTFNAAGKIIKPKRKYEGIKQGDFFSNLKAQAWWLVADRLRNTYDYKVNGNKKYNADDLISINSNINGLDALISELTTPYKDFDKSGRVKVESKDDLKKKGVNSPNRADAFIMALSQNLVSSNRVTQLEVIGF
jgi:phage terminase large subunit